MNLFQVWYGPEVLHYSLDFFSALLKVMQLSQQNPYKNVYQFSAATPEMATSGRLFHLLRSGLQHSSQDLHLLYREPAYGCLQAAGVSSLMPF